MNHERFMQDALNRAAAALEQGEFPVGCILVADGDIVASGTRSGSAGTQPNEIDHAEMVALRNLEPGTAMAAGGRLTAYCTMEPCLMCFGALLLHGVGCIVYAYEDVMGGGTSCDLSTLPPLYRDCRISIVDRVLRKESLALFKAFFRNPENAYWRDSFLAQYTLQQP